MKPSDWANKTFDLRDHSPDELENLERKLTGLYRERNYYQDELDKYLALENEWKSRLHDRISLLNDEILKTVKEKGEQNVRQEYFKRMADSGHTLWCLPSFLWQRNENTGYPIWVVFRPFTGNTAIITGISSKDIRRASYLPSCPLIVKYLVDGMERVLVVRKFLRDRTISIQDTFTGILPDYTRQKLVDIEEKGIFQYVFVVRMANWSNVKDPIPFPLRNKCVIFGVGPSIIPDSSDKIPILFYVDEFEALPPKKFP